jgi:DNA topoisomerase-1
MAADDRRGGSDGRGGRNGSGELDDECLAELVAEDAGLRYVTDAVPGIRRRRAGRGFTYRLPDGTPVTSERTRARIEALTIPPAWTDVWICRDPLGHLQATGRDARGRKQYRYHATWRRVRDAHKFDRLAEFGQSLPHLREQVAADLRRDGLPRERVLALVVRLLDDTLIRIGSERYAAENDTYGLTTLRPEHVEVTRGGAVFEFVGKSGIEHEVAVHDARLARVIRRCHELGGHHLFSYRTDGGDISTVTSSDVNEYLHGLLGVETSAKEFRTWGGSVVAAETMVGIDLADGAQADAAIDAAVLAGIDAAAAALRNSRAVCRSSYVHPAVVEGYRSGELLDAWKRARAGCGLGRAERATLTVLDRAAASPTGDR